MPSPIPSPIPFALHLPSSVRPHYCAHSRVKLCPFVPMNWTWRVLNASHRQHRKYDVVHSRHPSSYLSERPRNWRPNIADLLSLVFLVSVRVCRVFMFIYIIHTNAVFFCVVSSVAYIHFIYCRSNDGQAFVRAFASKSSLPTVAVVRAHRLAIQFGNKRVTHTQRTI